MRNFDERIAEINRRSEEILKRRRQQRKLVLSVCIPLVLLIAVASVTLPGQYENKAGAPAADGDTSLYSSVQSVRVTGSQVDVTNTDPQEIREICGVLYGIPEAEPESNQSVSEDNYGATLTPTGAPEEALGLTAGTIEAYTISLVNEQGADVSFSLSGATLVNDATKRKVVLSKYQLDRLKDLLGISD